jgi:inhibitor of KinA sporulation pathway (predicted exonuclease)
VYSLEPKRITGETALPECGCGASSIELNAKTLFAVSRGLPSEVGLPQAMALLGLKLEGTHHRGHDDAWNIAAVVWETLKKMRG